MSVTKEDTNVLSIDEHQLHVEWLGQAKLYGEFAKDLADKRAELDVAKSRLDVIKAEWDRDIRNEPGNYGVGKITESAVENCILLQIPYQKALGRVNNLKHEVAIAQAMVEALDHRKKALENLVVLWLNEYFAEPRKPRGEAGEKLDMAKKRAVRHGSK